MKKIILFVVVFAILGGGGYWLLKSEAKPQTQETPEQNTPETPTTTTPEPNPTPSPSPAPTPSPKPTQAPNTYTMAQVATHNSATSCYSAINGSVYNLTSWINQHPGGQNAILSICGKDGSDAFNGKHGGQPRPASELAGFKIGTLVN